MKRSIPPSSIVLRTRGDSSAAIGVLREAVASLDRQMPLANVQTMRQLERTVLGGRRFQLILIASFAVASLLLAAVGTYSVLAYAVSRRAREIAIRLALGSSPAVVRGMILRQGLRPMVLGLVLGLLAALLSGRLVAGSSPLIRRTRGRGGETIRPLVPGKVNGNHIDGCPRHRSAVLP